MNETVSDTIEKVQTVTMEQVLPGLIERLQKGEDFVMEQAPLVVQELLQWKFATSLLSFASWIIFFVLMFLNGKAFYKFISSEEHEYYDGEIAFGWFMLSLFILIAGTAICFDSSWLDWLQIWVAPRIYLIEYASELLK